MSKWMSATWLTIKYLHALQLIGKEILNSNGGKWTKFVVDR